MPRLSQTLCFLKSPSFQQVQSALIGQLTHWIVIGRTPQARVGNVTSLTIIASFSFQVSFISSSPKGEQSRVTDSDDARMYLQYTSLWLRRFLTGCTLRCDVTLFPSHTHTHTHNTTRYAQNSTFEQSIANTWTNNKAYLQSLIQKRQIVIAMSELTKIKIFLMKSKSFLTLHTVDLTYRGGTVHRCHGSVCTSVWGSRFDTISVQQEKNVFSLI